VKRLGQKSTHDESLQVNPIITEEEPYITRNPKATCSAAGSNGVVSMGVDLEDRIRSDRKHGCVRPKRHCQRTQSTTNREKAHEERATSFTSNRELAGNQRENTAVNRLTKPASNIHSCWSLTRTGTKSSATRAAESSPYIVRDANAPLYQGVVVTINSSLSRGAVVIPFP